MRTRLCPLLFIAFGLSVMPSSGLCQGGCDIDTVTINGDEVFYVQTQLQDTSTMIPPPPGYEYDGTDCWGHPCWCIRVGSGRIDALRALNLRYHRPCPSVVVRSTSSVGCAHRWEDETDYEITAFDLLGRRLGSFRVEGSTPGDTGLRTMLLGHGVRHRGIAFVRVRHAHGDTRWRVVP